MIRREISEKIVLEENFQNFETIQSTIKIAKQNNIDMLKYLIIGVGVKLSKCTSFQCRKMLGQS